MVILLVEKTPRLDAITCEFCGPPPGGSSNGKSVSAISGHRDIPCVLLLDDPANELFLSAGLGADRILTPRIPKSHCPFRALPTLCKISIQFNPGIHHGNGLACVRWCLLYYNRHSRICTAVLRFSPTRFIPRCPFPDLPET
jgi:hypothetical protein